MRSDPELNKLAQQMGVQFIQDPPASFTSTYVLGIQNGQSITVADMITEIEHAIQFIKATFDVNQEKYSLALKILKVFQLRFLNQQVKEPHKKDLHILLDVIHEMKDRWAKNDAEKSRNERTTLALSLLIDKYIIE